MKHVRQWLDTDPHSRERCTDVNQGTWCDTCGCCEHCVHNDCACPYCGCATSIDAQVATLTTAEDET